MNDLENLKFDFDHSELSPSLLQKVGIRSTLDLEEAILSSEWQDISDEELPNIFFCVGFSNKMRAICTVFTIDMETTIIKTCAARLSNPTEFKKYFCIMSK